MDNSVEFQYKTRGRGLRLPTEEDGRGRKRYLPDTREWALMTGGLENLNPSEARGVEASTASSVRGNGVARLTCAVRVPLQKIEKRVARLRP